MSSLEKKIDKLLNMVESLSKKVSGERKAKETDYSKQKFVPIRFFIDASVFQDFQVHLMYYSDTTDRIQNNASTADLFQAAFQITIPAREGTHWRENKVYKYQISTRFQGQVLSNVSRFAFELKINLLAPNYLGYEFNSDSDNPRIARVFPKEIRGNAPLDIYLRKEGVSFKSTSAIEVLTGKDYNLYGTIKMHVEKSSGETYLLFTEKEKTEDYEPHLLRSSPEK